MATPTPKATQVRLTYKLKKNGKPSLLPSVLHLKKGSLVEFVCAQGDLDLLLEPSDAWDPPSFRSGGAAVLVKKENGQIWCGGKFTLPAATRGGKPNSVTIKPGDKVCGSVNTPPPTT